MDTGRLHNSIMGLASANELQTLVYSFLTQYAKYLIAFNTIRGTENEPSFILISEPVPMIYRVAHEKPARRLVDQRGRRSWTLYRKLNKCKRKVLTG